MPFIVFPLMFLLRIFRFIFPLLMLYLIFRILSGILSPGPGGGGGFSGRRGDPSGSGSEDFRKEQRREPDSRGPRNPYEILGCSPGDTNEEVRRHYRDLVTKYHPDRFIGMDLDDDFVKLASERFSEIQEAYKTIRRLRGLS